MRDYLLSVVIPSLGGDLTETLDSIFTSRISQPIEVIICLPNISHTIKNISNYYNLRIIYSEQYGQVYQRIAGFRESKGEYVLQLDDDILLNKDCLRRLVRTLEILPKNSCISPCLFNIDGSPMYGQKKSGILSVYYQLINGKLGYKPGGITRAGTNFGVNPNEISERLIQVDWQPGGCVLHHKENLILYDYYPNKGKAYCEDLIHSFLLRESGVSLFVDTKAKCTTLLNPRLSFLKELMADYRARRYFVKLANLSVVRMWLHYMVYVVRFLKS